MSQPAPVETVDLIVSSPSSPLPPQPISSNSPRSLHRAGRWLIGVALVTAGIGVGVIGSRYFVSIPSSTDKPVDSSNEKSPETDASQVSLDETRQTAAGLEVSSMTPQPLTSRTWRTGRIALHEDRLSHICSPAEGVLREVMVKLGQTVAVGDKLAVIECKELGQSKLDAYRARLAVSAERELLTRTQTTMSNAEELLKLLAAETPIADIEKAMTGKPIGDLRQQLVGAYTRRNQLKEQVASQGAEGVVPGLTRRKTEAESAASDAAYTALLEEARFQVKNQVRQAELKLKEAETALDVAKTKLLLFGLTAQQVETINPVAEGATAAYLVITAPFAGVVVEKHAVRTERVEPKDQLFLLADLSQVWVQADVFEADLPLVRGLKQGTIVFRSTVAGVTERLATVLYAGDLIDKSSRSLTLTAEAENADRLLKPGLFVEVGFDTGDRAPALQVPSNAVMRHENKPFVFVQTTGNTFRRVDITLGRSAGDKVEVTSGLKTGDRVVVRGGFTLKSELLKDQMAGE